METSQLSHVEGNDRMAECIDNCFDAAKTCEWCATECIRMDDPEMNRCIELCRDVADVATLHARLMARDSDVSTEIASTCADLCEECAEECRKHDAEHCQICADVLQECADSCRDMAEA